MLIIPAISINDLLYHFPLQGVQRIEHHEAVIVSATAPELDQILRNYEHGETVRAGSKPSKFNRELQ
jgi:hypothetical protein